MSPPPMWKLTGTPASDTSDQIGSQWVEKTGGSPWASGWLQKLMPRCPLARQRSISATDASTSQNGIDVTASSRLGSTLQKSVRKSLYARTHASASSRSVHVEPVRRAEAADVRVQHLRADALLVLEREARDRIPCAVVHLVVGRRPVGQHAVEPGHRGLARDPEPLVARDPAVHAVDMDDVGDGVAPLRRDPRRPHVGRLGEVRVDVDHREPLEEGGRHVPIVPAMGDGSHLRPDDRLDLADGAVVHPEALGHRDPPGRARRLPARPA